MFDKSIDVAIPVHNRARELDRALSSLCAQHDQDFRVIVCDDGSSDDLSSVIDYWKTALCIDFIRINPSGGPARPRNICVQRSKAAWISFLDSDDWWFPHKIGEIRAALSEGVDFVYHPLKIERGLDRAALGFRRREVVGFPVLGPDVIMHMLRRGNPVATSGATVRRNTILSVGGFDEHLNRSAVEDFDCWLRLAARGAHFKFCPQVLGNYWFGGGNISSDLPRQYARYRKLFDKQLGMLPTKYIAEATSHFNYQLGMQAGALNMPERYSHLIHVRPQFGLLRWMRSQLVLASRAWRRPSR